MPGMRPEDVYEIVTAGDPRISPDGSRVAYTVTSIDKESSEYRTAIWVAPVDGSTEPAQFTSGSKRDASPRWSPDGRYLAFVSNRGDDKKTPLHLYVLPASGGEPRKLTDLKEGVEAIAWSPDSRRIAFSSRVPDEAYEEEDDRKRKPRRFRRVFHKLDSVGWTGDRRTHVFVVDVEAGPQSQQPEPRQLTNGDFEHGAPTWLDDDTLVFAGLRDENWDVELINRLYTLALDGDATPERITRDENTYETPSVSPDGTRIAFEFQLEDGTYPHHVQIGVMNRDGSDVRLLTESLDR